MSVSATVRPPRRYMIEITGFFAGLIFVFSGVVAMISSLASVTYLMYLIIVRASLLEALTTFGYMATALGAISLLAITAGKVSKACFSKSALPTKLVTEQA